LTNAAVADPPRKIAAVERAARRAARRAERSWWETHALNGPDAHAVIDHSWPWLAVGGMLAFAGCWWGIALPLAILGLILLVAWLTTRARP